VVVEVALDGRLEPFAGLRHWIVHAFAELLFDLSELSPHTLADRPALHREEPFSVLPTYVCESQKIERLGLFLTPSFPVLFGIPPELDPARFIWMKFQPKLRQPFPKVH
jgi:hypothetical protein